MVGDAVACNNRVATWAAGGDGAVAAVHAKRSSVVTMAIRFVETRGGGVLLIGRETVSPTIVKEFAAFDRDVLGGGVLIVSGRCRRRCGGGNGTVGRWRDDSSNAMGAMESRNASCETTNALLIAQLELGLEKGERPFIGRSKTDIVGGAGKKASLFEH